MEEVKIFEVLESDDDHRLDKFLCWKLPDFSRSEIQKFDVKKIKNGVLMPEKFSAIVRMGDKYRVVVPPQKSGNCILETKSVDFTLNILHEDDDIIVINKPRGIVMYPAAGNQTGTLVQNILSHTHLSALGGGSRPGVVHRLDKDTSGVVILAKSDAAFRELTKTFAAHNLTRKYIAFVWGVPNWETADITGNITRSTRNRQKMTMVKTGGKEAHTEVSVVNIWGKSGISELRCTLFTGRTHQIRVHLSSHGFPVLCDPIYGRGSSRLGSVKNMEILSFLKENSGQMLHAEILDLNHPVSGAPLHFKARLPADMQELKNILNTPA